MMQALESHCTRFMADSSTPTCARMLPLVQIGPDGAQYLSLALAQGQSLVTLKANGCALGDEVRVTPSSIPPPPLFS